MVSIVSAEEVSPAPSEFDVIIRSGTVYDGSGGEGRQADERCARSHAASAISKSATAR